MPARRSVPAALAVAVAVAVGLALAMSGCAASDWSAPHPRPSAVGELGEGFRPLTAPSPEATIDPEAGSWDDVHPSPGYRVVLLTAGSTRPSRTLAESVRRWASDESVDLREIDADGHLIDSIVAAMRLKPDLIISAGDPLVDPLTVVSASHLDRQFLVVGAELAEPTQNVTAVDWSGASFRGEGLGTSSRYDASSFTRERTDRAVRAGVAAVLNDLTGIVIWID